MPLQWTISPSTNSACISVWMRCFRCCLALVYILFLAHGTANGQTVRVLGGSQDQPLYGVMQATDGNYYSSSTYPLTDSCADNDNNECSGISKITPDGVVTTFHLFESSTAGSPDGQLPNPLIEAPDGNFYGTARTGGAGQQGTFFRITRAGVFTVLYSFNVDPASGSDPGAIILGQDGAFYGVTEFGGTNLVKQPDGTSRQDATGTLFRVTKDGTFTVLHTFSSSEGVSQTVAAFPAGIVQGTDGSFYGAGVATYDVNQSGNNQAPAVLYKVDATGTITILHTFALDGSEGAGVFGPLTAGPDGAFYGVALSSAPITGNGIYGNKLGTIFKITSGGSFQKLYTYLNNGVGNQVDQNLTLGSDGNFYGKAKFGGSNPACTYSTGCGDLFQITPSGTFAVMYNFTGGTADSGFPAGPLVQINNGSFIGTAFTNTVYNFTPATPLQGPIQISLVPVTAANQAVTLTWKVLNAFSATMQVCHAGILSTTGATDGAGTWSGPQTGKVDGLVYTGSATITPTKEGTYTYELSCGGIEVGSVTLVVGNAPMITTTAVPNGTVLKDYNAQIQATGGVLPYVWGYSGIFPAGLKIDPNTGFVSGQASQFGVYQVTFGVQDSSTPPQPATKTLQLTIDSGLQLIASLANGKVGTAYNATVTATGGVSPYKWALASGKLPDGLTLNATNGAITGTPTVADSFVFSVTVMDAEGKPATVTQSYTISTVVPPLTIVEGNFEDCTVNVLCEGQYEATGGKPPYSWAVAPGTTFPPGLTLTADGVFSGKPTQYSVNGNFVLTVQVTDSEDPAVKTTDAAGLKILSGLKITSLLLPPATIGVAYQAPAPIATGGTPPYTWKINSPNPQLILEYGVNPTVGALYSTGPVTPGTFSLFYTVFDSEGMPANTEMDETLIVNLPVVTSVTTLSSSNANAGTGMNVTLAAKVSSPGGTASGLVTFYNGTTSIGTGTLDASQTATLTTSFSTAGTYQLTALYAGSGTVTGSMSAPVTETVITPTVSAAFNPGTLTVTAGSSGTLTLTLTPTGGYTGTVALSCGSLPAHVSCSFSPQSLTIVAGTTSVSDTVTIRTSDAKTALLAAPEKRDARAILLGIGIFPALLFCGAPWIRRRKTLLSALLALFLLCLTLGMSSGCGSPSGSTAKAGTYTVQVSIQIANGQVQSAPLSLIVQ